jgi:argininosuccinate synthase
MTERIVFAYSGSDLDLPAITALASASEAEVVTLTLDVGQEQELEEARDRSLEAGAARAHVIDARDEFAHAFVLPALHAGAMLDASAPIACPLVQALIGKKLVEMACIEEATAIAHHASDLDRIRIENSVRALSPELRVLALGDGTVRTSRTCTNLWGRAVGYDAAKGPSESLYSWTKAPQAAPDVGAEVVLDFERGVPMAINGVALDLSELIESLSIIAGRHGVGRIAAIDHESQPGRVCRIHEAPAATVLHAAHEALEKAASAIDVTPLKHQMRRTYADLVVRGLWFTPVREALDAFNAVVQTQVIGSVRIELFKGSYTVAEVRTAASTRTSADTEFLTPDTHVVVPKL